MASPQSGSSTKARAVPAFALVAVAAACGFFVLSTKPIDDPTGIATGQAASLALPAIFTAVLALVAAGILFFAGDNQTAYRAGGLLGMCAAFGAVAGGFLNLVGYANSNIWWAADPGAIRTAAAVLFVVALIGLIVVAAEQLRPGWRAPQKPDVPPGE